MFFNYPHSSMQDMNLDWLIKISKESNEIIKKIEKETAEIVNTWITNNLDKVLLNASYNETTKTITIYLKAGEN